VILTGEYVRGFVDGEGSFRVLIMRGKDARIGWEIAMCFQIGLSRGEANLKVLREVKRFFGVGRIYEGEKMVVYLVQSLKEIIRRIIPFFEEHPLVVKRREFEVWKRLACELRMKRHLNRLGLKRYVIPLIEELYSLRKGKRPRKLLEELKSSLE